MSLNSGGAAAEASTSVDGAAGEPRTANGSDNLQESMDEQANTVNIVDPPPVSPEDQARQKRK
jgi:hypothetical protein